MKIAIIGAGAMGGALTIPASDRKNDVNLWGTKFDTNTIDNIKKNRYHPQLGIEVPDRVKSFYSNQLEESMEGADIVVVGVISDAVKHIAKKISPYLRKNTIVMIVSKGLKMDKGKIMTMSDIIKEELPRSVERNIFTLTVGGPSIASELARRVPTGVVYASQKIDAAETCKNAFSTSYYKIDLSEDLLGVSLCSALKNVYAISISLWDGIKKQKNIDTADNGRALFFHQALKEMRDLVETMGGDVKSVAGLAGVADLEVTARGGRNSMFGSLIGSGLGADEAIEEMKKKGRGTVEGHSTLKTTYSLAKNLEKQNKLEIQSTLPLLKGTYSIIYGDKPIEVSIKEILECM